MPFVFVCVFAFALVLFALAASVAAIAFLSFSSFRTALSKSSYRDNSALVAVTSSCCSFVITL